jgi:NADPH-dependent 2,4-dienoyl-CoA reductase/sulfur reductase-like enzyme
MVRETSDYVIVGAGVAGDGAARGVRERDPDGTVLMIGREPTAPVDRPALTKALWNDPGTTLDDVLLGTAVTAIDLAARTVTTDSGLTIGYGALILTTGGHPRPTGIEPSGRVIAYRTVHDYERLRDLAGQGRHVVVVGGGFIGTEIAAALVRHDTRVTQVVPTDVLTGHVFPAGLARHVDAMFADAGVTLLRGRRLVAGSSDADGAHVTLDNGTTLDADTVVLGTGIVPDAGIAAAAGLAVAGEHGADGIEVDDHLRTSDPHVWAAGDVARYPDALLGRRRVEHVDAAGTQGRHAGRAAAGADEVFDHTPYFWSDLLDAGYEAVGRLDASLDTVEDWHEDAYGAGVVYYLDAGRVVGVLLWNVWDATDRAREVIRDQRDVSEGALRGLIG